MAAHAAIIEERIATLRERAEKAKELEVLFGEQDPVESSLRALVARTVEPYRGDSDASITTDVDDVVLSVHPQLSVALEELVENAVDHGNGCAPTTVRVTSSTTPGCVVVAVEDDGPGIPDDELDVLEAGEETDLLHSSGIGLWLVKMIVGRFDGRLEIETGDWGTKIAVHVPRESTTDEADAPPTTTDEADAPPTACHEADVTPTTTDEADVPPTTSDPESSATTSDPDAPPTTGDRDAKGDAT
jgi:signal transduction histidine kinase